LLEVIEMKIFQLSIFLGLSPSSWFPRSHERCGLCSLWTGREFKHQNTKTLKYSTTSATETVKYRITAATETLNNRNAAVTEDV
jgi:hypothetical protein